VPSAASRCKMILFTSTEAMTRYWPRMGSQLGRFQAPSSAIFEGDINAKSRSQPAISLYYRPLGPILHAMLSRLLRGKFSRPRQSSLPLNASTKQILDRHHPCRLGLHECGAHFSRVGTLRRSDISGDSALSAESIWLRTYGCRSSTRLQGGLR